MFSFFFVNFFCFSKHTFLHKNKKEIFKSKTTVFHLDWHKFSFFFSKIFANFQYHTIKLGKKVAKFFPFFGFSITVRLCNIVIFVTFCLGSQIEWNQQKKKNKSFWSYLFFVVGLLLLFTRYSQETHTVFLRKFLFSYFQFLPIKFWIFFSLSLANLNYIYCLVTYFILFFVYFYKN